MANFGDTTPASNSHKTTAAQLISFRKELHEAGVFRPEHIESLVNEAAHSLLAASRDGVGSPLRVK
ncbi:hypothetical protein RCF19_29860 [Rhodococcus qingshengii]